MQTKPRNPGGSSGRRSDMEQTVPAEAFGAEGMRRYLLQTAADEATKEAPGRYLEGTRRDTDALTTRTGATTGIDQFVQASHLPADILDNPDLPGQRYAVRELIGKGATGRIYATDDRSLERTVAMKILTRSREKHHGRRASFIHEARSTAKLEHANILPVYDIGSTEAGEIFFTMKKITGRTLGDAIREACDSGKRSAEVATAGDVVSVVLKVSDALDYAHHHGYIHQDVKPDNIMIGEFGEVLLLDWGSAMPSGEIGAKEVGRGLVGTPAYMSPEQARREGADERSDIYCLGGTLLHALLLRFPTWADDPEVFWERKRAGVLDVPTRNERVGVPRPLLAIALKALEADAEDRYQTVRAMADDLRRFQNGQSVSAYHESVAERALRWYRRNSRAFWRATFASAVVAALAWLFLQEKLKEMISWKLLLVEDFTHLTTEGLGREWQAFHLTTPAQSTVVAAAEFGDTSHWRVEDGALVGRATAGYDNLCNARAVPGNLRIEWDVSSRRRNLDFNCYVGGRVRTQAYQFHVGGWNTPEYVVLTKASSDARGAESILDYATLPRGMEINRVYRFCMEKEDRSVRLFIDGRRVIEHEDLDLLSGPEHQYFGFENNWRNEQRIDNIRVYYQPLPQRISPLVVAEQFQGYRMYERALFRYREIADSYPGTDMAAIALFKQGRCLAALDSLDQARAAFSSMEDRYPRHRLVPHSIYERAKLARLHGESAVADSLCEVLGREYPGHSVLRTVFFSLTDSLRAALVVAAGGGNRSLRDSLMEAGRKSVERWAGVFVADLSHNGFLRFAATTLLRDGRYQEVLDRYPSQRRECASALRYLGRHQGVFDHYRDVPDEYAVALSDLGRFGDILREVPELRARCAQALLSMDSSEAVLQRYPDQREECALALLRLGRYREIVDRFRSLGYPADWAAVYSGAGDSLPVLFPDRLGIHADYLELTGRTAEILERYSDDPSSCAGALIALGRAEEALRRYGSNPGLAYLALRRLGRYHEVIERYPDNPVYAGESWLALGKPDSVLAKFAANEDLCVRALMARADYDTILTRYPHRPASCADALVASGRTDDLFRLYPAQRRLQAGVLLARGDHERLCRDYPDQRHATSTALLIAGHAERVRKRYGESSWIRASALLLLGLTDSIRGDLGFQPSIVAGGLIWQGRYDSIIRNYPEQRELSGFAHYAKILQSGGGKERAESLRRITLAPLGSHFASGGFGYPSFAAVLLPVSRVLVGGETTGLREELQGVLDTLHDVLGQRLWHDAALVAGDIDLGTWDRQPCRHGAEERRAVFAGIRADLAGDTAAALAFYGSYPRKAPMRPLSYEIPFEMFVEWRAAELRAPGRASP